MHIQRDKYLQDLCVRRHNGLIKVITGIRRCGKSYLLFHDFKAWLEAQGVPASHIIAIALDQRKYSKYRDPDEMLDYLEAQIRDDAYYYILLDEVQMLDEFESVLNSLLHIPNVDVYVTGSNSKFLSKDVITEFRGRGDEIHLYPLTFREFMSVCVEDVYHGWADFVTYGGLPLVAGMRQETQKVQYLKTLFTETYLKDIIDRNKIEKTVELEDLINVLASAVGSLTNPTKIQATFSSKLHSSISNNTIRQYLEYLEDAYIISKANRFDVKGRKYIGTPLKYYFEDVGLRNARLDFRQTEENHLMENVIYNELRYRGFSVDVGVVPIRLKGAGGKQGRASLEIDFIATLGSRKYYIQSAFSVPDEEKEHQEMEPLLRVDDSFKKIVVKKEVMHVMRNEQGITSMGLFDFLLKENSLEL